MRWNWKQNFARPGVSPGSFLVFFGMRRHHRALQEFAMAHFTLPAGGRILDIGCGGGDFLAEMLRRAPDSHFFGVDHSPLSVKKSSSRNHKAVVQGKVEIVEGGVSALPFGCDFFDLVTASETVYFWPDPPNDFHEVARVLKPGGVFALCCNATDKEAARKYTDRIEGMTVHTKEELVALFTNAGFHDVTCHADPDTGMFCATGRKPEQEG